ncbi:AraC-like DNA-binding protein [Nocardioides sp. J9]|uniref:helix-turn-helix domain-containing protein n=1 Tax=unclassified Nocardioides TaxID=2615069 RepID=UPI0011ACF687|nr:MULTISPECIES: helix-turn-helix transcriptional regulator [unclassified Nocardioides]TWG97839.1 AraC-like DNA-binding protein [Nocardioides sp. J9]
MIPVPPVPPALRRHVAARVPYDVVFGAPGVHRGLPSTTLTLVLPLDEPLRVAWAGQPDSLHGAASSLSGLHARPALVHHGGSQRGVQLALTVEGARVLLGRPAADLAGALTDLDEAAVPAPLRALPERLHAVPDWRTRVALVDRCLADLAAGGGDAAPRAEVAHALARLTAGRRVAEVADEVGYSRRRLGTLVRAETGLAPKDFQRVARLQHTRGLLGHRPLAEVAATCGYADQAHLAREWRALTGCTPTTWLREEFPFVQDRGEAGAAGSGHEHIEHP